MKLEIRSHIQDNEWYDEDPGYCPDCGVAWQIVRPGKSQPACDCYNFCSCGRRYEYWTESKPNPIFPNHFGEYCTICQVELLLKMAREGELI